MLRGDHPAAVLVARCVDEIVRRRLADLDDASIYSRRRAVVMFLHGVCFATAPHGKSSRLKRQLTV